MTSEPTDEGVRAANAAFYQALEAGDIHQMIRAWAHRDDVLCAHPGRAPLRGWDQVRQSWEMIFDAGGNPQLIVTDEQVTRRGVLAWVTVTENLLSDGAAGAATAFNLFEHDGERWRLVAHHAGPVLT